MENRMIDLEVLSVAEADGRDGPQWKLEVKWPWSKFPGQSWVNQSDFAKIERGKYRASISKGHLLPDKDPEKDWSYRWYIESLTPLDQMSPSSSNGPPPTAMRPPSDSRSASIERQSCLKAAVDVYVGSAHGPTTKILEIARATDFLHKVVAGSGPSTAWANLDAWIDERSIDEEVQQVWAGDLDYFRARETMIDFSLRVLRGQRNQPELGIDDMFFGLRLDEVQGIMAMIEQKESK